MEIIIIIFTLIIIFLLFLIYKDKLTLYKNEKYFLYSKEKIIDKIKQKEEEVYNNYKELKEQLDNNYALAELRLQKSYEEKQQQLSLLEIEFENYQEELKIKKSSCLEELNLLTKEIEEQKKIRKAIIELQKQEEQEKQQTMFYSIQISENELQDIAILRQIEKQINHKDIINKLIYTAFIKKPLDDMIQRVLPTKDKICGIYKITNKLNNLTYIGKSTDIKTRWQEHVKSYLDIGTIAHAKIHEAMKRDGIENFTFHLVEICSKEDYSKREKYWINFYDTVNYGYNEKLG